MINELHMLSQALEKNGINVPIRHPWIKGVKKGEALLVNFTKDGTVDSLEYCSPVQVKTFWNIEKGNHESFPKVNVDPLWGSAKKPELLKSIAEAGSKKEWDKWFSGIDELLKSTSEVFPKETAQQNSTWKKDKWRRLYKFSHEVILPQLSDDNAGLTELIQCFDPFETFKEEAFDCMFIQIAQMLVNDLKKGHLDCFKLAQHMLIGKPGAKQQPQVSLIFNHSSQRTLVADANESNALNKALSFSEGKENVHLCPLTGESTEDATVTFPSPNLPLLGNTFLMAMNKDAKCHMRYGKIGAGVFPASSSVTARLDNVLRYITSEDFRSRTWMPVASGKWEGHPKKEKRDLLICYAEEIPELQNKGLAFLMGGDSDSSEQRFESISSLVCDVLQKNRSGETSSKIRVFVIRKISKGQSQVVFNDFCSVAELFEAVKLWRQAANNHPPYALYLSVKKGEKAEKVSPLVPFPADLPRLLQYQWIREGTESSKLDGYSLVLAYDLFFERGGRTRASARQTLQLIIQRMRPLLVGIGRAGNATDFDVLNGYSIVSKRSALYAVAFIGIVLFKLGYTKEKYMKDAGYNIGRLLSLADCLHTEYCRHVRKGDIPNQLLGNTILRIALDDPINGLARLSERIVVYKAWVDRTHGEASKAKNRLDAKSKPSSEVAKVDTERSETTKDEKKDFRLAWWAKKQIGMVSEQLSEVKIPDSTDDVLKAQILLGYLAHTESKQENKNQGDDYE
jgi:hypothetical protein